MEKLKMHLTEQKNESIINLRLDIIKLVYSPSYQVSESIKKAMEIEDYILKCNTPDKDKVKA